MLTATFTSPENISFCISTTVSVELVRAAALWKCGQIGEIADGLSFTCTFIGLYVPQELVVIEH